MKSKLGGWAIASLGVLGIVFLSGAFKRFLNWDKTQTKVAGGLFTLGAGLVGALAAHKLGLIDGDTKNLVIGASVAVGTYQAAGQRVESFGSELIDGLRKNKRGATRTSNSGAGLDEDKDMAGNSDELDFDLPPVRGDGLIGGGLPSGVSNTAPAGPALPAAGGTTTINYAAPQVQAPNPWLSLGTAAIGGLATVLGSALAPDQINIGIPGGSAGARRGPMSLAGFNMRG